MTEPLTIRNSITLTCRKCYSHRRVLREWWEPAEAIEVCGLCPKCSTGTEKDEEWTYYDAACNEIWVDRPPEDEVLP